MCRVLNVRLNNHDCSLNDFCRQGLKIRYARTESTWTDEWETKKGH